MDVLKTEYATHGIARMMHVRNACMSTVGGKSVLCIAGVCADSRADLAFVFFRFVRSLSRDGESSSALALPSIASLTSSSMCAWRDSDARSGLGDMTIRTSGDRIACICCASAASRSVVCSAAMFASSPLSDTDDDTSVCIAFTIELRCLFCEGVLKCGPHTFRKLLDQHDAQLDQHGYA